MAPVRGLILTASNHRRSCIKLGNVGLRYREIMELLGVTNTNVNRHLTEVRAELREAA